MNESAAEPPDHLLLQQMGERERSPAIAGRAFEIFYDRHKDHVYDQACYIKRKFRMKQLDEADFVCQVFRKVWQSACKTYSREKSNDEVEERLSVRAWLGRMMKNLLLDEIGARAKVQTHDDGVELTTSSDFLDEFTTQDPSELIHVVNTVLSERDAKVVWFKIEAYDPATGQCEPDPSAVEAFCFENSITPEYLRKIYSRAIATLREAMAPSVPLIHRQ